jgi:hypothetical protein
LTAENESLRQGIRIGALGAVAMGAMVVFNVVSQSAPVTTTDAGITPAAATSFPPLLVTTTPTPAASVHSLPTPFSPPEHPWRELPGS